MINNRGKVDLIKTGTQAKTSKQSNKQEQNRRKFKEKKKL